MKHFGKLELVAFLTGFSLMAFELVAARILAPSIGSSTYVWTSVIGVIIAALALGYWTSGVIADRRNRSSDVVWLLLLAATMVVLTLVSYPAILDWVLYVASDSRVQALIAAFILFAPASYLLGATSPYLVKLNITSIQTSGSKVASLSALNSLGGITGTFATGFILFGYIGSRETFGIVVILLVLASWLIAHTYRPKQRILLTIALIALLLLPMQSVKSIADIDTPSAHYQVANYKSLLGDVVGLTTGPSGIQSAVYAGGSSNLVFWYTNELARLIIAQQPQRVLVLGGGAFTLPQYLSSKLPNSAIDVVEIDPELKWISEKYFGYTNPDNVSLIFNDARTYVNQSQKQYDAIVVDVYGDSSIPFSLMTREFGKELAARTSSDGVVYINLIAGKVGACRDVLDAVDGAYRQDLPYSSYSTEVPGETARANYIIAYSRQPLVATGMTTLERVSELSYTDNFAPAERLSFNCRAQAASEQSSY